MSNIKQSYLTKYDLSQPQDYLVKRYAKFLYDSIPEKRFKRNKDYLLNLQKHHKISVEDLSDFDYEEFDDLKREHMVKFDVDDVDAEDSKEEDH